VLERVNSQDNVHRFIILFVRFGPWNLVQLYNITHSETCSKYLPSSNRPAQFLTKRLLVRDSDYHKLNITIYGKIVVTGTYFPDGLLDEPERADYSGLSLGRLLSQTKHIYHSKPNMVTQVR